jgi:signal transduction histidine kinase
MKQGADTFAVETIRHSTKISLMIKQMFLAAALVGSGISELAAEPVIHDDLINRCASNCDRLIRLLDDVSMITRMDEAPEQIRK